MKQCSSGDLTVGKTRDEARDMCALVRKDKPTSHQG